MAPPVPRPPPLLPRRALTSPKSCFPSPQDNAALLDAAPAAERRRVPPLPLLDQERLPSQTHQFLSPYASQRVPAFSAPQTHIILPKNWPNSRHASASLKGCGYRVRAYPSDGAVRGEGVSHFDFDSFLSIAELVCLVSSAVVSVVFAVKRAAFGAAGDRVLGWLVVALVGSVASGAWVRRRQWRRVFEQPGKAAVPNVNLVERVEKLEEDLRSSATMIRVLSRQLEKLGIRFRVTRKTLKEPIAETAALAQKNSEATRALAMQEDILEKELGEIQKVLLAMQDQQQKQLELILAIGKTGKLWESRRAPNPEHTNESTSLAEEGVKQLEINQTKAPMVSQGTES